MQIRRGSSLVACSLLLCWAGTAWAQSDAERAAKAGKIALMKGFRVLRLFGPDAGERGFAHGYLLAAEIVADTEAALRSLPGMTPEKYAQKLLPWTQKFEWDDEARAELDGIFAGMTARLGADEMMFAFAGREYRRADLDAINVVADYFGPACSGFSVWNKRTADGSVLHARTLDFPIGARAVKDQIVIVSEPAGEGARLRRGWVAVGWPGLIVQFTGMNAGGVVLCMHDGYNTIKARESAPFYARGLLLRRLLEAIDPMRSEPAEQAAALIEKHSAAGGNLFHLTWPKRAGEKFGVPPSAVLEFDQSSRKADIRRMDESGALVLTNHFLLHNTAVPCDRFQHISDGLELLKKAGRTVGLAEARKLLMSAEQFVAAHSVYFLPDKLELQIALTKENIPSPRVAPVPFSLKELFER